MSEWIAWTGGKCPVPGETQVEVRLNWGSRNAMITAGDWDWGKDGGIIAYRVAPPAP